MKKRKGFLPLKALGKRVVVRFEDHSIYDTSPTECEIMGVVEKLNEKEVILRWWSTFNGEEIIPDVGDNNNEVARIIQGTIVKWALVEPKKWELV
jgi:hypothetical protein